MTASSVQTFAATDEAELVRRVQAGDCEAAAEFFQRHQDVLRQRIRRRLRRAERRIFDSQDILSTVSRRLDRMVRERTVRALNGAQLMSLVLQIAANSVVDKVRVLEGMRRVEGPDSDLADRIRGQVESTERRRPEGGEEVIARVLEGLTGAGEREVMSLWLRGWTLKSIAEEFRTEPATMRKRWEAIRTKSLAILASEDLA